MRILFIVAVLFVSTACTDDRPFNLSPTRLASCNGKPPGQQPSGNPAQAPGQSSSNDKDCRN